VNKLLIDITSTSSNRIILFLRLISGYVQSTTADWVVARDHFSPGIYLPSAGTPGVMQNLIRHGGLIHHGGLVRLSGPNF
jgi:hypothetical protein